MLILHCNLHSQYVTTKKRNYLRNNNNRYKLRIHCFQHISFEGLACIDNWIEKHEHNLSYTKFYENPSFPNLEDFDWLIIMGGTMNIYQESEYPWLKEEKEFIAKAIKANKLIVVYR